MSTVPVVLFAYARPAHLRRVLDCLRANRVPRIVAFADGARGRGDEAAVAETRAVLREVDWCPLELHERAENLGLGRNVISGVSSVAAADERFVVWEDDLVASAGTYAWICRALERYAGAQSVMSVSAWTHPRVTPTDIGAGGYFDARAECWVWGSYARSWQGMDRQSAEEKMIAAEARGIARDAYGADLPVMARAEKRKNIWAVRWLYHHLAAGGLCLRPPASLVEHIGFDATASNAATASEWANRSLSNPPGPVVPWPEPAENRNCARLWRAANPPQSALAKIQRRWKTAPVRARLARAWKGRNWFQGSYGSWEEAAAGCTGYDAGVIADRVLKATLAVRAGEAAFERDSVLFPTYEDEPGLVGVLRAVAARHGGRLRLIDFGGALGSTYWRHRQALADLVEVRWDVVEQPAFVAAGRQHLGDSGVRFFPTIAAAASAGPHDVLLASTVLQYLPQPRETLRDWLARDFSSVILNNLPLHEGAPDRIARQVVPPEIYPASYPVWFFNREQFLASIGVPWRVEREFSSEAIWPVAMRDYRSTGLWLTRT